MKLITRIDNVAALCDSVGFGFHAAQANNADSSSILYKQLVHSRSTPVHPRWIYIEAIIESMNRASDAWPKIAATAIKEAQAKIDETVKQ